MSDVVRPNVAWFVVLDGGMAVLKVLALSERAYEAANERVPLPSRRSLQGLFAAAAVVHFGEAAYAYKRASRAGLASPGGWALQTAIVGFPSLLKLRRVTAE